MNTDNIKNILEEMKTGAEKLSKDLKRGTYGRAYLDGYQKAIDDVLERLNETPQEAEDAE